MLTDNEIIKALELCIDDECRCGECPYFGIASDSVPCGKQHGIDMLDLINRQKAEIDSACVFLEEQRKCSHQEHEEQMKMLKEIEEQIPLALARARTEAIKEFAERLKAEMQNIPRMEYGSGDIYFLVSKTLIDNTMKEMMEGKS